MNKLKEVNKGKMTSGGDFLTNLLGKLRDNVGNLLNPKEITKEDEINEILEKLSEDNKIKISKILELNNVGILIKYLLMKSYVEKSIDGYRLAKSLINKLTDEEKVQLYNEIEIIRETQLIKDSDRNPLTFMFNDIERLCPLSVQKKDN